MDAFEDHEDRLQDQAYQAGESQGYDQGMYRITVWH